MALGAGVVSGVGGALAGAVFKHTMKETTPAFLAFGAETGFIGKACGCFCGVFVGLSHACERGLIDILKFVDVLVQF